MSAHHIFASGTLDISRFETIWLENVLAKQQPSSFSLCPFACPSQALVNEVH